MNDSSEFDHAVALSLEIAHRLRDELEDHKAGLEQWIKHLTDSPPESWTPNVFAASLSESEDLLSQWRAYGTGGGGPFCIGLPSETLPAGCTDGSTPGPLAAGEVHLRPR